MRASAPALACLALAAAGLAQSPTLVLEVGDALPNGSHVTDFASPRTNSFGGTWQVRVATDDPGASAALLSGGDVVASVGDALGSLGGGTVASMRSSSWDLFAIPAWIADVTGGPFTEAVMYGKSVQFAAGAPATDYTSQFPPGSTWRRFEAVDYATAGISYMVRGAIDDALGGQSDLEFAATAWHGGSIGVLWYVEVLALEGALAPGLQRAIEGVPSDPGLAWAGFEGLHVLWSCDLEGSTLDDRCVYRTTDGSTAQAQLLAREGSPSPVPGRTWGPLEDVGVGGNRAGMWSLRAQLDASDTTNDEVLVVDGAVFAREGDAHPVSAPYPLESLGQGAAPVDENGRVLWFARWDDPSTPGVDEALVHDSITVVRTGVTKVDGVLLVDLESGPESYNLHHYNGRWVLFVGTLADGTRGLFQLDQGAITAYCDGKPSSVNCTPKLSWGGQPPSASAGSGFTLTGAVLPNQAAVLFYGVDGPATLPFFGGTLCVQPPLRRAAATTTGGTSFCSGLIELDFNAWIASGVDPALQPGRRVFAQAWCRDPGFAPPDDVGLTNGLTFVVGP